MSPWLVRAVKFVPESLARGARRVHALIVSRHLAGRPSFSFTTNYIEGHTLMWERCLGLFRGRPDVRMLEIGSFEGRSAVWFLDHILTGPSASLTCLDLWWHPVRRVRFDHNIRLSGAGARVRTLRARSAEALLALASERFEIVYIDGSHRAADVLMDAAFAWPLLEPGGVMMFDDYEWGSHLPLLETPKPAIDGFLALIARQYDLLHHEYQVIIQKRPG